MTTNQTIWIVVTERGDRPYVCTTKPTREFLEAFAQPSEVFGRMYLVEAQVLLPDVDDVANGDVRRMEGRCEVVRLQKQVTSGSEK